MPPWPCTIALGSPVVPGRVEDPERVVEGDLLELERRGLGQQLVPARRDHHRVLERRDRRRDLANALAAVEVLAAVAVAVGREQHLRLDLGEAVDHGRGAELRRAARPDRADARRGQQRDDRLRRVRQVGHHAVAAPDPEPAQPRGAARHLVASARPRRPRRELGPRRRGRSPARPGAPSGARARRSSAARPGTTRRRASRGSPSTRSYGCEACTLEALPERAPEPLQVLHRPAPELVVAGYAAVGDQPCHLRALAVPRLPEPCALRHPQDLKTGVDSRRPGWPESAHRAGREAASHAARKSKSKGISGCRQCRCRIEGSAQS